jgi:lauroyl/myristoyl acyltransferase
MVRLFRLIPMTWASWIAGEMGARRGRAAIKADRLWVQRLRANLTRFCGVKDPAELDRRVIAFTRRLGRSYAEYAFLQRLFASGRVEMLGGENLDAAGKPFILVGCHIGNWELIGGLAQKWGGSAVLYLPLASRVREDLARDVREAWPDIELIPASPDAMLGIDAVMRLDRALAQGKNLAIFIDEERQGYVWAPSLGRNLPYAGNRWLAARLAARHSAPLVPAFVETLGLGKHRIVIQPKLEAPVELTGEALSRHFADQLDARLEAWIRPRIETWYWLPYFDPDVSCPMRRPDKPNHV